MEYVLCFVFALICAAIYVAATCHGSISRSDPGPTGSSYSDQFRTVELQNGMYRVQRWDDCRKAWETPFGHNTFDTLAEAQAKKAALVGDMVERDGYRVKRVVD